MFVHCLHLSTALREVIEERQNYVANKRRRKQEAHSTQQDDDGKRPAGKPATKAETTAKRRAFHEDGDCLQEEKCRRAAISSASRHGNYQLMHDAAEEKARSKSGLRSKSRRQRAKHVPMRHIAKCPVPAIAPEIANARRQDRPIH